MPPRCELIFIGDHFFWGGHICLGQSPGCLCILCPHSRSCQECSEAKPPGREAAVPGTGTDFSVPVRIQVCSLSAGVVGKAEHLQGHLLTSRWYQAPPWWDNGCERLIVELEAQRKSCYCFQQTLPSTPPAGGEGPETPGQRCMRQTFKSQAPASCLRQACPAPWGDPGDIGGRFSMDKTPSAA